MNMYEDPNDNSKNIKDFLQSKKLFISFRNISKNNEIIENS